MSIYDEFKTALIDHDFFGNGRVRLYAARARVKADPDYDDRKYRQTVLDAKRTVTAFRLHLYALG
jgi:hypothetical protein